MHPVPVQRSRIRSGRAEEGLGLDSWQRCFKISRDAWIVYVSVSDLENS